ncbi:hypothetical protein E2562_024231 [Oryza meyeriana var. granulata]|uniref:Glucose-6-phosphate isomerase n=1 Tax=Oryza meyeriana var. granulata TaxID=110450 RepID=A0A6G1E1L0_9ORYZ|nr:hypothetical protein E2562_024231 [Oryza meyeriana var. granulata]
MVSDTCTVPSPAMRPRRRRRMACGCLRTAYAFAAMGELEKGAITNPDEGRMVGHYWLRDPGLAPTPSSALRSRPLSTASSPSPTTSSPIKPLSSPAGCFTQILSIGIGGSALGPQFISEALAPDNPP